MRQLGFLLAGILIAAILCLNFSESLNLFDDAAESFTQSHEATRSSSPSETFVEFWCASEFSYCLQVNQPKIAENENKQQKFMPLNFANTEREVFRQLKSRSVFGERLVVFGSVPLSRVTILRI